jgi:hypothetical protein
VGIVIAVVLILRALRNLLYVIVHVAYLIIICDFSGKFFIKKTFVVLFDVIPVLTLFDVSIVLDKAEFVAYLVIIRDSWALASPVII